MLALCYHGHLSKEFVRKVFSEEYLRHVDKHITAEPLVILPRFLIILRPRVCKVKIVGFKGSKVASDLRDKFMELNRAVCIDMPEAGIRWFHGKYCQDVTKLGMLSSVASIGRRKIRKLMHNRIMWNNCFQRDHVPGHWSISKFVKPC